MMHGMGTRLWVRRGWGSVPGKGTSSAKIWRQEHTGKIWIIHYGRSRVWLVMWEDGLGSHHEFRLYLKDNGEKHHQIHLLEIQLPGGKWIREDERWFALLAPMLTVPCIHTLAMASQWTEDTFYRLALGQAIQSVLASGRWQKQPCAISKLRH